MPNNKNISPINFIPLLFFYLFHLIIVTIIIFKANLGTALVISISAIAFILLILLIPLCIKIIKKKIPLSNELTTKATYKASFLAWISYISISIISLAISSLLAAFEYTLESILSFTFIGFAFASFIAIFIFIYSSYQILKSKEYLNESI